MKYWLDFSEIASGDLFEVGGKGFALGELARQGFPVPGGLALTVSAYRHFLRETGLEGRIVRELGRKPLKEMRWEEIWDAALRIRHLFASTEIPAGLARELRAAVGEKFGRRPVVVRSSAPGEDSADRSFAGLHESFVNVRGTEKILEKIVLVWASLWSDRALLYRRELKLDPAGSAMAVAVQEMVNGERSGVAFTVSPENDDRGLIEAVWGLNEGLVDGTVGPDHWVLDRATGRVISHTPAQREWRVGTVLKELDPRQADQPPLDDKRLKMVFDLFRPLEEYLGGPADFEWTFKGTRLCLLQCRPITAGRGEKVEPGERLWERDDRRPWYLNLQRSFANLKKLRERIEGELIPEMEKEAKRLDGVRLDRLSDRELRAEIKNRSAIRDRWREVYWSEFIPFAHGIRLFGQVYNDAVRPEDPYEFMDLLASDGTEIAGRRKLLEELAGLIRNDPELDRKLERGESGPEDSRFEKGLEEFMDRFGELSCGVSQCALGREGIVAILREMAAQPAREKQKKNPGREADFLASFSGERREAAKEVLDLARASYRLRDEDNIHLSRIEGQLLKAEKEAERRGLRPRTPKRAAGKQKPGSDGGAERPRQLTGQPANPGMVRGRARVVRTPADLFKFKAGEVLVIDAIEPEMTFVVPLAGGIVERRGGMLVHGAIIAREYGLPCVTGVPEAVEKIPDGAEVTVDGYRGIVVIHSGEFSSNQG
ncbi:MAG: PEP/pyruvate-binding domain-containing protein [Candidatus Erginobacter occultus]|nr:PEP/pyruvate-binding domain-containing protein [Candidatus Erginobacter occultus]